MRRALVALACVVLFGQGTAYSQVGTVITPSMLMPSPLGIVLTVGQWILAERKPVYYIEVKGVGRSQGEARNNGFRLAVEQAIGTLISSETEVQNGRIRRDEIISYAAGFVEKFEIVGVQETNQGVEVSMKVWVGRSALADRLLNKSETAGTVDGATASVRLQTLTQERTDGDALLNSVLKDFFKRGFVIELKPTRVIRDGRSVALEVPFKITWSQDYLKSLWAALDATGQKTSSPKSIIGVNSGGLFRGYGGQARYDDEYKYSMLVNTMVLSRPSVLVTVLKEDRTPLFRSCYNWQELSHRAEYNIRSERFVQLGNLYPSAFVDGAVKLNGVAEVPLHPSQLSGASIVEMAIIPNQECPNR